MAENNLGSTQYFRTKPDQELEVKEILDLVYNAMEEKGYNPLSYRYLGLNSYYHNQLTFSYDILDGAENAYLKLKRKVASLKDEGVIDKDKVDAYIIKFKNTL